MKVAQHVGKLPDGRRVTRWPVLFLFNSAGPASTVSDWLSPRKAETTVLAPTASAAADWALAQVVGVPNVEITVIGPKGGTAARRFQGWESSVWSQMCQPRERAEQLNLLTTPQS